jgi:glycosyltransferase involved in cell wall biosynthesis
MKIFLLTSHLNYGGISSYTLSLAEGLKQHGHSVCVVSDRGTLVGELEKKGIEHFLLGINTSSEFNLKLLFAFAHLLEKVKNARPDLLHAQTRVTQLLAEKIRKKTGINYVSTCHGFFRPHFYRKNFPYWGARVIAISQPVKEHLVREHGVAEDKVVVIHNGVEREKFSRSYSSEEKAKLRKFFSLASAPTIGIIARLSPVKGHLYLLQAFAKIIKEKPEAQLFIVGDGPEEKNLKALALRLGIKERVVFYPSLADTADALALIDIFVLPSLQEGLGLGILEAQAAGKPVVASDIGGIGAIIRQGENGFLTPPKDVARLAEAISKLLDDGRLCRQLGERGREIVSSEFSLNQEITAVEGVYRSAIEENIHQA